MSTAKRPKATRTRKSATTTAKAAKKGRAKAAVPPPPPPSSFGANAVMIPTTDVLLGAQFNANVNCRPVKNRKGKTRQKCDRQRLAVVGGATPSAEHPKRKQLFAVQVGQRFTVADREIRRDLRAGAGARARHAPAPTCADFERDIRAGAVVPGSAYEMCPTLPDAVEPAGGGDTSFDFKFNGAYKANHHGGHHAPGDPLGVYLPAVGEWARGGGRFIWTHRILGWMFRVYPNRSGRGFDASVAVDPESLRSFRFPTPVGGHARSPVFEVAEGAPSASSARDALAEWYSYVRKANAAHHLGGYKANRAPTGAVPGQTYADRRADDLRGLRVSGDDYSGQVRERAVGLDGRAPSHIVGGHVLPRSRIAAAVKREALRALPAPRGATMNVMSADEGMRRMDEIMAVQEARETRAAVRAPLQLGPGTPEPLRPRPPRPAPAPVAPVGLSDAELAAEFERLLTGKANGRRRYR